MSRTALTRMRHPWWFRRLAHHPKRYLYELEIIGAKAISFSFLFESGKDLKRSQE
jgi:hypothetical protein